MDEKVAVSGWLEESKEELIPFIQKPIEMLWKNIVVRWSTQLILLQVGTI